MNKAFLGKSCDCGLGKFVSTEYFSEWWVKCEACGKFVFTYLPMPHQARFHADPAKYKMWGGGFGSAKTSTCGAEFTMLALSTPNGVGLVGAATYPQLEQTSKKQILDMIPEEFIDNYNKKDNVLALTNGYKILFRSFDDEQKLKSLNLCHAWIEEANGVDYSIFVQLQTRLRHHATKHHKILLTTNPAMNWVRTEILLKSKFIFGAKEKYNRTLEDINPNMTTHIARTDQNIHLPEGYLESVKVGKPEYWIRRNLEGSFSFADGMVYPMFSDHIVDISPEIIRHNVRTKGWQVIGASDFGIVDPTTLLLAAIDPDEGVVYLYDEYAKTQQSVPYHAKEIKRRLGHIPDGALMKLMGDPSGARRNINDQKSIFNHYQEYGIFFQKADNRIDAGIMKVYSYLEMGKLKILSHLKETIEEHSNYQYKPSDLEDAPDDKPIDKKNHLVDSCRYLIQELPDDPDMLKTLTYGVSDFREVGEQDHLPFALRDDEPEQSGDAWYYGNY